MLLPHILQANLFSKKIIIDSFLAFSDMEKNVN